jgi:predicted PhzF superfamily epimerase YddE/YHI9
MGRPSVLYLSGRRAAGGFTIEVGGKAQHIAEGRLRTG